MSTQFDRYEMIAELGQGGMATVYRAFDPRFKREVAVKVLPREFLHDKLFRDRFEREAQTIAALDHPAIVPVYDYGEYDGQPFLVMRYMQGGALSDWIAHGRLTLEQVTGIMARVCEALDVAHQRGMIHRDIKPGNILFDQYNYAYLSDFGIVKLTESTAHLTGSGIVGTPAYMAPEMMNPEDLTPLIDIYALGITLYQMLTGEHPFSAPTPMGVLMAHINKPLPHIGDLRPDLPAEVQSIIERAAAKDSTQRYQTPVELAAALQAIDGSAPVVEPTMTAVSPQEMVTMDIEPALAQAAQETAVPLDDQTPIAAVSAPETPVEQPAYEETMEQSSAPAVEATVAARPAPRKGPPLLVWVAGGLLIVAVLVIGVVVLGGKPAAGEASQNQGGMPEQLPAEETAAGVIAQTDVPAPTEDTTAILTPTPATLSAFIPGKPVLEAQEFDTYPYLPDTWKLTKATGVASYANGIASLKAPDFSISLVSSGYQTGQTILISVNPSRAVAGGSISVDTGKWETPSIREWAVIIDPSQFSSSANEGMEYEMPGWTADGLSPSLSAENDTWYVVMLHIGGEGKPFVARVWDRENPTSYMQIEYEFDEIQDDLHWQFAIWVQEGSELQFDRFELIDGLPDLLFWN